MPALRRCFDYRPPRAISPIFGVDVAIVSRSGEWVYLPGRSGPTRLSRAAGGTRTKLPRGTAAPPWPVPCPARDLLTQHDPLGLHYAISTLHARLPDEADELEIGANQRPI